MISRAFCLSRGTLPAEEDVGEAKLLCKTDNIDIFISPLSNEYYLAAKHFCPNTDDLLYMHEAASALIFADPEEKTRIKEKIGVYRIESAVSY